MSKQKHMGYLHSEQKGSNIYHTHSGKKFQIIDYYTCGTPYVVYLIKCPYSLACVGETTQPVKECISKNKSTIWCKNLLLPIPNHFIFHNHKISQLKFQVTEQLSTPRRGGDRIKILKQREAYWIHMSYTLHPRGLRQLTSGGYHVTALRAWTSLHLDIVPVYQIKGISKLVKLCLPKVQCFCDSLTSSPSERQRYSQRTVPQLWSRKRLFSPMHDKSKRLSSTISTLLATEMLPFCLVDTDGFRKLMDVAVPQYQLPSHHYFSKKAVPALHQHVADNLTHSLTKSMSPR
ncbi:unnamed protein product, partial [Ranitomeya imitator]